MSTLSAFGLGVVAGMALLFAAAWHAGAPRPVREDSARLDSVTYDDIKLRVDDAFAPAELS